MIESSRRSRARIALIHFRGDFDTVPALRSMVTLLAQHGYSVDIIHMRDPAFLPPRLEPHVTLIPVPRLSRRGIPTALRRTFEGALWFLVTLVRCLQRRYEWLVGVDPVGLIAGGLAGVLCRTGVVYLSLELYLSKEISDTHIRLMKWLERFFNRRCRFTIVQDEQRGKLLADENGLASESIVLLPNSPLGKSDGLRRTYLRDRLGLPADARVILYAGAITEWTYTRELIEVSQGWPSDWAFVVHNRQRGNELGLKFADFPWVRITDGPVAYDDLPELIGSADVGLVLYRNAHTVWQGENMTHVGLSSGKLAQYLRCGVPVAVIAFPGLHELVARYHCGVSVTDPSDLRIAIETILQDYDHYREGALRCFDEVFAFEPRFDAVLRRLGRGDRVAHA